MKIAVTGKGGVGKTTFAATLARLYAAEGKNVLAADVDPDANLGLALGFPEEPLDSIVPITKMRKLVQERTGANDDNKFYKINPKVDDIPDTYSKTFNDIKYAGSGNGRYRRKRLCMSGARDAETHHQPSGSSEQRCGDHGYGSRS